MTETTIKNYQERAARTMPDLGTKAANGAHMALGVTTEIGELEEGLERKDLVNVREEHGDANWYIANLCNIYSMDFTILYEVAEEQIEKGLREPFKLHDLVDLHKREFAYGKDIDVDDLFDELLNLMTYLISVARVCEFTFEESLIKNIDKLYQRFPNKFTQEDALNRDLEKEREILE